MYYKTNRLPYNGLLFGSTKMDLKWKEQDILYVTFSENLRDQKHCDKIKLKIYCLVLVELCNNLHVLQYQTLHNQSYLIVGEKGQK